MMARGARRGRWLVRCQLRRGTLCRSRIRFWLRDLLILVDETVHHLPTSYPHAGQISNRRRKRVAVGWALPAPLTRAMAVVVRQVLARYSLSTVSRWRVP